MSDSKKDNIKPDHYKQTSLECYEAMILMYSPDMVIIWCEITAYKYCWRWQCKNGLEDLKKAKEYLDIIDKIKEDYDVDVIDGVQLDSMRKYIDMHLKKGD